MRVAVLGSGRGSNARALLEAQRAGLLGTASVAVILSDQPAAGILALGPAFGVEARFVDPGPFRTKLEGDGEARFIEAVRASGAGLVVLAGFMRVLKPGFLGAFPGRVINLHPSLLPSFPGLDAIGQAWRKGVRVTGCTVHGVTADLDCGPILDQAEVRVAPGDTLESLEARVHQAEHRLLPSVVARIASGEIRLGASG
jgi:phosphoribosylglycinamide formyltransferase 1